jgi:hypothetical protein
LHYDITNEICEVLLTEVEAVWGYLLMLSKTEAGVPGFGLPGYVLLPDSAIANDHA